MRGGWEHVPYFMHHVGQYIEATGDVHRAIAERERGIRDGIPPLSMNVTSALFLASVS